MNLQKGPAAANGPGEIQSSTKSTTLAVRVQPVPTDLIAESVTYDQFDADTPTETLVDAVCEAHGEAVRGHLTLAPFYIRAGYALIEAKKRHPKRFMDWVEHECGFGQKTAWRYMKIASLHEAGELTVEFFLTGNQRKALPDPKTEPAPDDPAIDGEPASDEPEASPPAPEETESETDRVQRDIAEGKEVFASVLADVQFLRSSVKRLSAMPHGRFIRLQSIEHKLSTAQSELKFAMPATCPYCNTTPKTDCSACQGFGWTSYGTSRDAPRELREAVKASK